MANEDVVRNKTRAKKKQISSLMLFVFLSLGGGAKTEEKEAGNGNEKFLLINRWFIFE